MRILAQITPEEPWGRPMRYDYSDPGTDRAYCDGLRVEDETPVSLSHAIDPVSHAAQAIHAAAGDLLDIAAKHSSSLEARRMFDLARALRDRLDAVIDLTGDQMNTLPLHPF